MVKLEKKILKAILVVQWQGDKVIEGFTKHF